MILYGAGMSDSNAHSPSTTCRSCCSAAGRALKGGRHLNYPARTPLANLHLTLLDKLGVPVERSGTAKAGP